MREHRTARRRTRDDTQRGTALLETALVLPFLLLLAIGLSEIGFLSVDQLTAANAAREGARVGAAAAKNATADTSILRSVEQAFCSLHYGTLTKVEIYKADAAGNPLNAATGLNEYTPNGSLNCSNSGTTNLVCANGCPWTPASRSNTVSDTVTPDSLGVRVTYTHRWVTNILPFLPTGPWVDKATMRLEPDNGISS